MLQDRCRIIVQTRWDGKPAHALIALHARRSADSVAEFHAGAPGRLIAVVLTGTDLYRDLPQSREAARSLDLAARIVTLQDDALRLLTDAWRAKADVIFQSAAALRKNAKARDRLVCVAVGHLREEKDPRTLFGAMARLPASLPIVLRHIGAPLDARLASEAGKLAAHESRYRYLGALPHGLTRAAIKAAHLLVHPSAMEGGANVIVEAVTSHTPVVASRISGNLGMLGAHYAGYFEAGDESGLASRLVQAWEDRDYLATLARQCAARRPLFNPAAEARAVRRLLSRLLA